MARFIGLLQHIGPAVGAPHVKHLTGRLWELRPSAHRVIYFLATGRRFVLLHAFGKKSNKTPRSEIATAERRMADFITGEEAS